MIPSIRRLLVALLIFATMVLVGGCGYYVLGHQRWSFFECIYMTVITIFTVGFGELPHMHEVRFARAFTTILIVGGVGTMTYVQGSLTAILVEGAIGKAFRRTRMRKAIEALKGHVVVAGAGSTGKHVIDELVLSQTPLVAIDRNRELLDRLSRDHFGGKLLYVGGDATDDHVLIEAGVRRAKGVVAALTHDKDNLFVVLSARSLNGSARIVAKVEESTTTAKMVKAGATSVVSPTIIGGRQMASEIVRPRVNQFLEHLLRDKDQNLRLDELTVPDGSSLVGMRLDETPLGRDKRMFIIAARGADRVFTYNPGLTATIDPGTTFIVMGEAESISALREVILDSAPRRSIVP